MSLITKQEEKGEKGILGAKLPPILMRAVFYNNGINSHQTKNVVKLVFLASVFLVTVVFLERCNANSGLLRKV